MFLTQQLKCCNETGVKSYLLFLIKKKQCMCFGYKYRSLCVECSISLMVSIILMFLKYSFSLILGKRFCELLWTSAVRTRTECSDRSNRIGSTEWKNGIFTVWFKYLLSSSFHVIVAISGAQCWPSQWAISLVRWTHMCAGSSCQISFESVLNLHSELEKCVLISRCSCKLFRNWFFCLWYDCHHASSQGSGCILTKVEH